jgi:hypothetical protein
MSEPRESAGPEADGGLSSNARPKKPYERPDFVREQVFETMALACGKTNPTTGQCKTVKKRS